MSEYTEQEAALEKRKCKKCNGIGTLMVRFEYEPCPACNETGFAADKFAEFKKRNKYEIEDLVELVCQSTEYHAEDMLMELIQDSFKAGQEAGE